MVGTQLKLYAILNDSDVMITIMVAMVQIQ